MINYLKITNFKKHGSKTITLTPGLNGIFGPNYTGKTTILYAILFALGGASQVPGTNLQKKGTNTGMGVVMSFTAGGVHYRVERKKSGAYLYQVGGPTSDMMLASGTSNVTEKIEEILGMSVKRFRQLKYAEQKKAHALLTLGAGELHKIIEELTGIDEINSALDKLKDMILVCSGAIETLTYTDPDGTVKEAEVLSRRAENLTDQLKGLDALVIAKDTVLADLNFKKRELTKARIALSEWTEKSAALLAEKQRAEDTLSILAIRVDPLHCHEISDTFAADSQVIKDLTDELKQGRKFQTEFDGLNNSRRKMTADISSAIKAVERSTKSLAEYPADLEKRAEDLEKKKDASLKMAVEAEAEYNSLEKMLKEQRCPTCFRDYEHAHGKEVDLQKLETLGAQKDKALVEHSQYKELAKGARSDLSAKHQEANDLRQRESTLSKWVAELEDVESKINAIPEIPNVSALESKLRDLNLEYSRKVDHYKDQCELSEDIYRVKDTVKVKEEEIASLPPAPVYKEQDLIEVEEWITGVTEDRDSLTTSVQASNKELSTSQFNLSACKLLLNKIAEDNERYEQANKRFNTAKQLQKYLRDNRDRYTGDVWDFFLGTASSFVSDCTNGAITRIVRTDSGAFEYYEGEDCMGMKDASGAQEAIMGLSVQMALAQAAQCPLDILLVDEPTADMDAEHSMAVSALLSTKGSQIIAVSHREMDASLCNNVINLEIEA